jgi:Protein of unknown function (DUF3307)
MVVTMLLAHLIGDYILQWDSLARWKNRKMKGVLAHGLIILLVTWAFSLPLDTHWWPWVLFIGLTHTAIDAIPLWLGKRVPLQGAGMFALARFLVDQTLHISVIVIALTASGHAVLPSLAADLGTRLRHQREMAFLLGYVFITMPAWILIEFAVYGLVKGCAPDFSQANNNKYIGILERGLITTFVVMGQFVLVPVVSLPRLIFEAPEVRANQQSTFYVAELLASVTLAVAIGLLLRML